MHAVYRPADKTEADTIQYHGKYLERFLDAVATEDPEYHFEPALNRLAEHGLQLYIGMFRPHQMAAFTKVVPPNVLCGLNVLSSAPTTYDDGPDLDGIYPESFW
jgi:hypothetical protein